MSSKPYTVLLDPETDTSLKIYLYKNVQNVDAIRNNVIKGVWNCAVIKPNLILNPLQVAVAANKAVVAEKLGSMVTKTVYAEILYNLSLSKKITQSLSKFGIEKEENLLVCFIVTQKNDNTSEILEQIEGELCPISELNTLTCLKDVKNAYKLNNFNNDDSLLNVVISRMATKNFVSY